MVKRLTVAPDLRKSKKELSVEDVSQLTGVLKKLLEAQQQLANFSNDVHELKKLKAELDTAIKAVKQIGTVNSDDIMSLQQATDELASDIKLLRQEIDGIQTDIKSEKVKPDIEKNLEIIKTIAMSHKQNTDTALGVQDDHLNMGGHRVLNLGDPTDEKEATNKKYVDEKTQRAERAASQGAGGGSATLRGLNDVVISSSPTDNQPLAYDSASRKWVNQNIGGTGDMTKAVYDPNEDGVIDKAELDTDLANTSGTNTGDQTLAGLGGIAHSLATAVNDFLVASGAGVFVKKTLAQTLTLLGKAAASGLASLNSSTKVVQQPASITDHLEGTPTEDLATKAPTSEYMFDHDADAGAHHTKYLDAEAVSAVEAAGLTFAENKGIILDAVLSGDGKYSGITEAGTAGATLAFGDSVYLASTGKWLLAKADAAATSKDKLGMVVLAADGDTDPTTVLLYGKIRAATLPTLTVGAPVHVSAATAGDVVVAAPTGTTNFVVRIIGYGNTAEDLFFCPDNTYVELA